MFILNFHDTNEVRSYKKKVSEEDLIIFEISGNTDIPEISVQNQDDQILIASFAVSEYMGRDRWIVHEIHNCMPIEKEFDFVTVEVKKN